MTSIGFVGNPTPYWAEALDLACAQTPRAAADTLDLNPTVARKRALTASVLPLANAPSIAETREQTCQWAYRLGERGRPKDAAHTLRAMQKSPSLDFDYRVPAGYAMNLMAHLDHLNAKGVLGALTVNRVDGPIPDVAVVCERLWALKGIVSGYTQTLRILEQAAPRGRLIELNGENALREVRETAASGIVYAAAEAQKWVNDLFCINGNAGLRDFVEQMLDSGQLTPESPELVGYFSCRQHPFYDEIVRCCRPYELGDCAAIHAHWTAWHQAETNDLRRLNSESLPLVSRVFEAQLNT